MTISDPLFVTTPINIRYLTGFIGAAPEEREAYVLLANDKTYLFTNALYIEQAKHLDRKIIIIEITRENPISKELAKKTIELRITTLGFEDTNLTVAELTKLKTELPNVTLIPTRNRIETLRQIKQPDEIENIKQACRLTDECFTHIRSKLTPGVEEGEIAWEMQSFFRKCGASDAFSPIVAFGSHSSMPHYNPTQTRKSFGVPQDKQGFVLGKNDVALFDFGARVNGYCADMTRMVFIGEPKSDWKKAYNTVLAAQQKALDLLASGERNGAVLDAAARDIITNAGLPIYPHSLGHAVGLDIHESPRLSVKKDPSASSTQVLKPGMIFSVEPGVYIQGQYGIRIEDLILLKKDGIEILSKSKKDLIIL